MQVKKKTTSQLQILIALALPTITEEFLATLLQYVDTAMVGRLGEQATAAVSITTTVTWLVNSIPGAIGTAILVLLAGAYGAGDTERIQSLSQQALLLALAAGGVLTLCSVTLSPYIPVWMGAEVSIQKEASQYFLIVSLPLVFRACNTMLGATLRAVQDTRTPMLINMCANGFNVLLNYLMIYRIGLGVAGAAVASALSYTISGCLMFTAFRRNKMLNWRWSGPSPDKSILQECAKVGLPVLGTSAVSCLGYVVFASLVSDMGTTVFAAHSIAVTAETIFYMPGYGMRTATSALVGAAHGKGDAQKVRRISSMSVCFTVGMMCVTGALLYLCALPLMKLFTPSTQVAQLGAEMLRMVAFSEPFFGLMIVLTGIYYGLGRTKYPLLIEMTGMWGVRILFTFLCVRVWHMDLRAVWYCMIADNICKAILLTIPFALKRPRSKLSK